MGSYSSEDPSYKIHAIESDGDCAESWAAGNDTQSMLPIQEVIESNMRMTPYPPLLTKSDEADDYTSSLLPVQPILPLLLEELEANIDFPPTPLPESTGKFKFVNVIETIFFFEHLILRSDIMIQRLSLIR